MGALNELFSEVVEGPDGEIGDVLIEGADDEAPDGESAQFAAEGDLPVTSKTAAAKVAGASLAARTFDPITRRLEALLKKN